jgi:microcystin-dependent protein
MIATQQVQAQGFLVGEVVLFAGTNVPPGFLPLDGRSVPIAGNESLFRVVGTQYGGDGVNNFLLPNLIGVAPVGRTGGTAPTAQAAQLVVRLPDGSEQPAAGFPGSASGVNLQTLPDDTVTLAQLRAALSGESGGSEAEEEELESARLIPLAD